MEFDLMAAVSSVGVPTAVLFFVLVKIDKTLVGLTNSVNKLIAVKEGE